VKAMPTRILILESDQNAREDLQRILAGGRYEAILVAEAESAQRMLEGGFYDLIVCDIRARADGDDTNFIRWCTRRFPNTTVIATSDHEDGESDEKALRDGAWGHLHRPFQDAAALLVIQRADERQRMRRSDALLQRELDRVAGDRPIVAASASMIDLLERIERGASFQAPVLLSGEWGTGKEGLARVIHSLSARRHQPFVAVPCGSDSVEELESALFGRADTLDEAGGPPQPGLLVDAKGGTLYLDEISALSMPLQLQLLRALRDEEVQPVGGIKPHPIDVRIIASTRVDLSASVSVGDFSDELLQRLGSLQFTAPPLRERREDIPLLVDFYFARACAALHKSLRTVADDALERLVGYSWPGNVRELENVIERAVLVARSDRVARQDLPESVLSPPPEDQGQEAADFALRRARKRLESDLIRRALRATGGNRTRAARLLEISHRALLYKIKEHRIRD